MEVLTDADTGVTIQWRDGATFNVLARDGTALDVSTNYQASSLPRARRIAADWWQEKQAQ